MRVNCQQKGHCHPVKRVHRPSVAFFNDWDFRDHMSVSPGEQSSCQYGMNIREVRKKRGKTAEFLAEGTAIAFRSPSLVATAER